MKEFDTNGIELSTFQAEVFEESIDMCEESSPIFLRRFYLSDYAHTLDEEDASIISLDINEAFASLNEQYGKTSYGKTKYTKEALYWLGYFSRYVCYTREISSKAFYRLFDVIDIYSLYEAYHTQSEEWCLAHLLSKYGYTESTLDKNQHLKEILRSNLNLSL